MAGELSKANRKKAIARAVKVLPPGTEVRSVVVGRAQPRWSTSAIVIMSTFGAMILIGLAIGRILYPGAILLLIFSQAYRPPRGLVIADQGVASMTRSRLSGDFKDVLAYDSLGALNGVLTNSSRKVQVGSDMITLSKREVRQLQQVAPLTTAPLQPVPLPTWVV